MLWYEGWYHATSPGTREVEEEAGEGGQDMRGLHDTQPTLPTLPAQPTSSAHGRMLRAAYPQPVAGAG